MIHPLFIMAIENEDDRNFIGELYKKYYPIMKSKAYEIVRDYSVVDDLINEAFIRLISKIEILRKLECCKRSAYIVYTIRNLSINYSKRRSAASEKLFMGLSDDLMGVIPDGRPSIEDAFTAKEGYIETIKAMERLSKRDRDLLFYKYNLNFADKEISEIMDIPVNNIREYLVRARRRALNILEKEGGYAR